MQLAAEVPEYVGEELDLAPLVPEERISPTNVQQFDRSRTIGWANHSLNWKVPIEQLWLPIDSFVRSDTCAHLQDHVHYM